MSTDLVWIKSSYSTSDGGECVEFSRGLVASGLIPVRDSKDPGASVLFFSGVGWVSFVAMLKSETLTR